MAQFSLFSFFILVLVSHVLEGRRHKIESEDYVREEPELEFTKKRNSFALASLDEAEDLPNAEYMRKVLKGIALDLATLRKAMKKTLGSLELLNGKSEPSRSEPSREIIPVPNRFPQLFGTSLSGDSIYPYPMYPHLNTPNGAENIGSSLENNPVSLSQPSPSSGFTQPRTYQQLLSDMNGPPQLSENMGQVPNENFVFQRG